MFKKTIEFIFFGSIFLAVCVVAMCIETNLLLHLPLNYPGFYFFVFGAALVQYNLHYLAKINGPGNSPRFIWSKKNVSTHLIIICAGLILMVSGLFTFHVRHFLVLLVVGVITLLYSFPVLPFTNKKRIKDYGVLKITTLSIIWTVITVWFPIDQSYYTSTSFLLIFLRRFIFIFSLCIVFDIRDIEIDYKENIITIPIIAGVKKAYNISFILLVIFVLLSLIQYMRLQNIKEFTALLISAVATFFIIKYTQKNRSDLAYIVCLDGMMLLQAMLIMIASV